MMIRAFIRKKFQPLIYRIIKWYYRKPRTLKKRGIEFTLLPTVFHPGFYHSTEFLLDFVLKRDLTDKNVLELGCGSGFISMYLAKETEANCFASDINPNAVEGLKKNANALTLDITVVKSNLFDDLDTLPVLDYILVNPPYFQKEITSLDEYAFFTGKNHAYFEKFFPQIIKHLEGGTEVYFVLSENVHLDEVKEIAAKSKVDLSLLDSKIINNETFIILGLRLL